MRDDSAALPNEPTATGISADIEMVMIKPSLTCIVIVDGLLQGSSSRCT
jgi:hypothetical protein